jgi:putative FmdB family regulatory protein
MPLYDFRCRTCGEEFEEFAAPGQTKPCPACGAPDAERVYQAFAGPFTGGAPRGLAARRSNAQRRVREELRAERKAERQARRREQGG